MGGVCSQTASNNDNKYNEVSVVSVLFINDGGPSTRWATFITVPIENIKKRVITIVVGKSCRYTW